MHPQYSLVPKIGTALMISCKSSHFIEALLEYRGLADINCNNICLITSTIVILLLMWDD